jgi:DNA-binding winged helix-turn-helix (wHTH) protein/TolB-like protein
MDRAISLEARRVDLSIELPFLLGRARVDPPAHEVTVDRRSTRMQPQTVKVLVALHDKSGSVVTRDELVDRCWDGRIVGDDVINRCILLLRRFAEDCGGFRIDTVPRAGYRLVEGEPRSAVARKRRWFAPAAAFAVALAAIGGWAWVDRKPPSQGVPPTPSISVVPFTAASNDPLTRQIAQAAPLSISHMMAESGFAIVRDDPVDNRGPTTDYLFSGNVRRDGNAVDATVQLVSRRDGTVLYAHDFNAPLDKASDLPDRMGAAVAAELAWTGAQMILDPREHLSPEIASELMKSIILTIEAHNDLRAYQLARHAAAAAPSSAFAQLGLAVQTGFSMSSIPEGERMEALALGRQAGDRALAMAPEFGDAYLTWCLLHSPVRMVECDAHVRRALEVDSSSSFVPGYLSSLLYDAGQIDESLKLAVQSLSNDPYKPAKLARMIRMDEVAGRSDEAEQVYRQAIRLWPDDRRMRASRLLGLAEAGNYAGLAAFADPAADEPMIGPKAFTALLAAERKHDLPGVRRACAAKDLTAFTSSLCMTILADLGDRDSSFAVAASLYPVARPSREGEEDSAWVNEDGYDTALLNAPAAWAMRTDPRFLGLAQRLGLLAYWRKRGLPDFCTRAHEPVCTELQRELGRTRFQ